jgi:predicted metallopeptidase
VKYYLAEDIFDLTIRIIRKLELNHIDIERLQCIRSIGSKSKLTVARIHAIGRVWEIAFGIKPRYVIEVISERYDFFSQEEKERVLIHELLHIPNHFSGGFSPHKGRINRWTVERLHSKYKQHSD